MGARTPVLLLTVCAAIAASAAVLSAQRPQQPLFPGQPVPPPRTSPLFPVQPFDGQQPQAPPQARPAPLFPEKVANLPPDLKPRVVCGMTLIPAPPTVDPKIALPEQTEKPKNPTTYTIRPVQPSTCW
jgi:hypothetical protein